MSRAAAKIAAGLLVSTAVSVGSASAAVSSVSCDNGTHDCGTNLDSVSQVATDVAIESQPDGESPATLAERFRALVLAWRREAPAWLDPSHRVAHPTYRAIVALGAEAIPLLLEELRVDRDFWFYALREITGENPVRWWKRGNVDAMSRAWIAWGQRRDRSG